MTEPRIHWIDSHCHLDLAVFDLDRALVLKRAQALGVRQLVIPAVTRRGWSQLLHCCTASPALYPALGLHPMFQDEHTKEDLIALERALDDPTVIAVGEIGLDFHKPVPDRSTQQDFFRCQLAIAHQASLPVLLHVRKAHDVALSILRQADVCGGIVHAFNGSLQQARQYNDLGFKLGFGGMLSLPQSRKLQRLVRDLPLATLVLETDAPDLSGFGHQDQRNSPEFLPEYGRCLAQLRGLEPAALADIVCSNTCDVLRLH
ncbi:MAG TPA: TatD family deoxyribonuclease [Gammaproteobacteria bacterium]|nr:TatD family deoxyribonuclease [Gammaproteobacteria bacterium]